MENPPIFKFGKPSISMGHRKTMAMLVITRDLSSNAIVRMGESRGPWHDWLLVMAGESGASQNMCVSLRSSPYFHVFFGRKSHMFFRSLLMNSSCFRYFPTCFSGFLPHVPPCLRTSNRSNPWAQVKEAWDAHPWRCGSFEKCPRNLQVVCCF